MVPDLDNDPIELERRRRRASRLTKQFPDESAFFDRIARPPAAEAVTVRLRPAEPKKGLSNVPYHAASVPDAKLLLLGELFGIPELGAKSPDTYRTRSGRSWDVSLPPSERPHAYLMAEVRAASVKLRLESPDARRHRFLHPGAHSRRSLPSEVRRVFRSDPRDDSAAFLARLASLSLSDLQAKAGHRSLITEFSEKSQARLRSIAHELQALGIEADFMLTLTYPGPWRDAVPCGKTAKRHLQAMKKRLARYFRKLGYNWSALWFLEFQTRGAPHFHLIIWGPALKHLDFRRARRWLLDAWADIVNHPDPLHRARGRKAGTGFDQMRTRHFGYASKYASKKSQKLVPERYQNVGRFWGLWQFRLPPPTTFAIGASSDLLQKLSLQLVIAVHKHSVPFANRICGLLEADKPNGSITVFGQKAARAVLSLSNSAP